MEVLLGTRVPATVQINTAGTSAHSLSPAPLNKAPYALHHALSATAEPPSAIGPSPHESPSAGSGRAAAIGSVWGKEDTNSERGGFWECHKVGSV